MLCAATAGQWNSTNNSCVNECYNATFLFSGTCKEECPQGLLQTGTMQKACAGVTHYASRCTGPQLGPIGIFKELECTEYDFRLANINTHSLTHPQCGYHKCFYRSRHDPKIGYVVVPYSEPKTDVHWLLTESYPYATRLAATYHIRHGLVGPPLVMDLSELFAKQLAQGIGKHAATMSGHNVWSKGTVPFRCAKRFWSFLVQRVEATPANARILKFWVLEKSKVYNGPGAGVMLLEQFVGEQNNETRLRTLQKDLFAATNMLAGELGLVRDFQMMFVPHTGHLLQMDLDRARGVKLVNDAARVHENKLVREGQQKIVVLLNSLSEKLKQRLVAIGGDNGG